LTEPKQQPSMGEMDRDDPSRLIKISIWLFKHKD